MKETRSTASCAACASRLGPGPLLVAIADPAHARSALHCARLLGHALNRTIGLAHAAIPSLSPAEILARLGLTPAELAGAPIWPIAAAPLEGLPLAAREHEAGLIVLALPAAGSPLGPIRERVLAEAPCPVLLVPPVLRAGWGEGGRVLLPLDGTPTMAAAVPLASELALAFAGSLDILHVAGDVTPEPGALTVPRFLDQPQHEWAAWRAEFLQRFCTCSWGGRPPVELRLFVRAGSATDAIRRVANERRSDLVVLGWRGRLDGGHAATLHAVLSGAKRPVLALRLDDLPQHTCG